MELPLADRRPTFDQKVDDAVACLDRDQHLAAAQRPSRRAPIPRCCLSPFDPALFLMQHGIATGHFYEGRYDEAATSAAKSIGEYPNIRQHGELRQRATPYWVERSRRKKLWPVSDNSIPRSE